MRFVKDEAIAEDIASETFERALRSIDKFTPGSYFSAWIYTIARNTSINYLRARKRGKIDLYELKFFDETMESPFPSPEENISMKRSYERTEKFIDDAVSDSFREAAKLRFLNDYSCGEIHEELGIKFGTVLSKLYRGRREMRRYLQEHNFRKCNLEDQGLQTDSYKKAA